MNVSSSSAGAAPLDAHAAAIASAYDAVAGEYDRLMRRDRWMRSVLWREYRRHFRSGCRVVDLGCGTGIDALHLAGRGIDVTAVDVSTGMLARLSEKARASGLERRVTVRAGDMAGLDLAPASADGIVCAFAALNTVADLASLAGRCRRTLRPGGRMIVHALSGRGASASGDAGASAHARAEPGQSSRTIVVCGHPIEHHAFAPHDLYRRGFAGHFRLHRAYALGFALPSSLAARLPCAVMQAVGRLESRLGAMAPFVARGRFFVLDLEAAPALK